MLILGAGQLDALMKYTSRLEGNNIVSNQTNLIRTSNKHCCKYNRVVLSSFGETNQLTTVLTFYVVNFLFFITTIFRIIKHKQVNYLNVYYRGDLDMNTGLVLFSGHGPLVEWSLIWTLSKYETKRKPRRII